MEDTQFVQVKVSVKLPSREIMPATPVVLGFPPLLVKFQPLIDRKRIVGASLADGYDLFMRYQGKFATRSRLRE